MYQGNSTQNALQVKRIIGQRDARLKKNQDKAVVESKRKSKDELVREMSVSTYFFVFKFSNVSQTSSFIISFLSIQHRYVSFPMDLLPRGRLPRLNEYLMISSDWRQRLTLDILRSSRPTVFCRRYYLYQSILLIIQLLMQ